MPPGTRARSATRGDRADPEEDLGLRPRVRLARRDLRRDRGRACAPSPDGKRAAPRARDAAARARLRSTSQHAQRADSDGVDPEGPSMMWKTWAGLAGGVVVAVSGAYLAGRSATRECPGGFPLQRPDLLSWSPDGGPKVSADAEVSGGGCNADAGVRIRLVYAKQSPSPSCPICPEVIDCEATSGASATPASAVAHSDAPVLPPTVVTVPVAQNSRSGQGWWDVQGGTEPFNAWTAHIGAGVWPGALFDVDWLRPIRVGADYTPADSKRVVFSVGVRP